MVTTVGATSVIITFAAVYNAEPMCVISAEEAVVIAGKDTAGFTASASGNIDALNYLCYELL